MSWWRAQLFEKTVYNKVQCEQYLWDKLHWAYFNSNLRRQIQFLRQSVFPGSSCLFWFDPAVWNLLIPFCFKNFSMNMLFVTLSNDLVIQVSCYFSGHEVNDRIIALYCFIYEIAFFNVVTIFKSWPHM